MESRALLRAVRSYDIVVGGCGYQLLKTLCQFFNFSRFSVFFLFASAVVAGFAEFAGAAFFSFFCTMVIVQIKLIGCSSA